MKMDYTVFIQKVKILRWANDDKKVIYAMKKGLDFSITSGVSK